MANLIVVGCGDHYQSNVAATLAAMQAAGEIAVVATVDRRPFAAPGGTPHIVRRDGQSLAECLQPFGALDPVVFLAHAHEFHAPDARDLVAAGFRVIVEKPYAISPADMAAFRVLVREHPRRVAPVESFAVMRAIPLLYAAGLVEPDTFYTRGPGSLQVPATGPTLAEVRGTLQAIGRPRMVLTDVLEGQGARGRFEHRGVQYADSRVGIGVILDMALHSLGPLHALESVTGVLPPAPEVSVRTAVCDRLVRHAADAHGVPPRFVPETYAEIELSTATGVPVLVCVGKYVLPQAIQRRLVIVGDQGEAFLDLTTSTLSIGTREGTPRPVLSLPCAGALGYRAVLLACLGMLAGETLYGFDPAEAALRANELCLDLHQRAVEQAAERPSYAEGVFPGAILGARCTHPPCPG
jgi:predicted dehydrogenase